MVKLQIVSDLHLEFSDIEIKNNGADVLILAGDIMVAEPLHDHPPPAEELSEDQLNQLGPLQRAAYRFRNFLGRVSKEFKDVIYIAGNHEFYNGRFNGSLKHLKDECSKFSNIHFLENETVTITDTTFIGCTLWTDLDRASPNAMFDAQNMMNDYRKIRYDQGVGDNLSFSKLRSMNTVQRHHQSLQYIKHVIDNQPNSKYVVVGHHAPSHLSVDELYRGQSTNYAYYSDLSEFILDRPQIKLWVHGHTHNKFDYNIGDTRIVCNPRGYCHNGNEQYTGWDQSMVVEV